MLIRFVAYASVMCVLLLGSAAESSDSDNVVAEQGVAASGTFAPMGAPAAPPVKTNAGAGCVVELTKSYAITGTLSGVLEIDYRILVLGPCGSPPGTFDEDWIAHGTFVGTVNGADASGNLSYVAHVVAGGDIEGEIALGPGLSGSLDVRGNFADGELSYSGWVK